MVSRLPIRFDLIASVVIFPTQFSTSIVKSHIAYSHVHNPRHNPVRRVGVGFGAEEVFIPFDEALLSSEF